MNKYVLSENRDYTNDWVWTMWEQWPTKVTSKSDEIKAGEYKSLNVHHGS